MLYPQDFAAFFREVHGVDPFPWQRRLLLQVAGAEDGRWPAMLDLPTGAGKTAAIDIALFHLALQATRGERRRAPVRIAFVVDRRLVVDDAFARALRLQHKLEQALMEEGAHSISRQVAHALKTLAGDGPPLLVCRLRGGIPREGDWARTPSQPTVLCSTVDQIGSRLLFRGYGVSDSMKPLHAGLIGADCLILLDEAHLAEPFRQTLGWVAHYRGEVWREAEYAAPWGLSLLSATPGQAVPEAFRLDVEDGAHPVLQRRLQARKPARLRVEGGDELRRQAFIEEVQGALVAGAQAVGVVLNRVARARELFNRLRQVLQPEQAELVLLIGPSRPVQREQAAESLERIRTGRPRVPGRPLVVVATQCIEAGVDIDLDALFTEAAPLDALRQRFGRLNRDGRPIKVSAAIIAIKEEVGARADDPVYRTALRDAWLALNVAAGDAPLSGDRKRKRNADGEPAAGPVVDFGIAHFCVPLTDAAMSERSNAPVLMPAHLDLLVQTAPVPGNDPEISLYLHGPSRQPDAVTLIWRADLNAGNRGQDVARLLTLVPPRAGEGIELPVWVVRRWLIAPNERIDTLADLPAPAPEGTSRTGARGGVVSRRVFRWRGPDDDDSHWISGERVRSGDTIVVPASYGGVDEYGWDPSFTGPATDLADAAAEPHHRRYFALRVAPGLVGEVEPNQLADALAALRNERWETVRDGVCRLPLPAGLNSLLKGLCNARGRRGHPAVELYFDVYGARDDDAPQGLVLVAPQGLKRQRMPGLEDGFSPAATEDDFNGSAAGFAQSLKEHSTQVEARAEAFAASAGLPPTRVADLKLAGWLHDQGKRDPRFQRWMHHGDPLGADPDNEDTVLAKSGRLLSPSAREKAGLPLHWRHEALSVRLARGEERLQRAHDAELVLWLVGTHHGRGRPLFPHADPMESVPDIGPQSLAFDWNGKNWPMLFDCLRARYGAWELAHMEAILRLADHRASEAAANAKENEA